MDWCLIADLSSILPKAWTIIQGLIAVGLLIFVHELGHFLAAKACGVKVEKFYIGFDIPLKFGRLVLPSALCRFRWGETEYGMGVLPLGGYVKMLGQDDNPAGQARENERIKLPSPPAEGSTAADGPLVTNVAGSAASGDASSETRKHVLDPRSYPAKPVWQRMTIISAGVIMNLLFAVIFAAIAYRSGISYVPCIVGGTAAGDPAWVLGLSAGDKIIQIGREGHEDEGLRFDKDLMSNIMLNGPDQDLDLLIRRRGQAEPEWDSLRPTGRFKNVKDVERPATLGVRPPNTTKLVHLAPEGDSRYRSAGYRKLQADDEIVAVDGVELPRDATLDAILSYQLEAVLAQRLTEPITLTIQRLPTPVDKTHTPAAAERFDVSLPPTPKRVLGLALKIGPVMGVRRGAPADRAGFRVGDVLVSVNGQAVGDPLTLAQRLLPLVGQEIEIRVERKDQQVPILLLVTPQPPSTYEDTIGPGSWLGLESLGVAVAVQNVVQAVEPGSPAARAGLRPGDQLIKAQVLPLEKGSDNKLAELFPKSYFQSIALDDELTNWPAFQSGLQYALPKMDVKLTYRRGDEDSTVTVTPVDADQWYEASRGLAFQRLTQVRTVQSWSEALRLGLRETKVRSFEVLGVLKRLLTKEIPIGNLGGPGAIIGAAVSEASHGVPNLLLFLTWLSANLAVLNFLPIPALDGGHMVFLAAEGIRGKPVDEKLQITLTLIGIVCLLSLMILVCYFDFDRYLLH
ncbi:MAG: site-2 protease family protein [Planctomycetota bacterium]|nr:site-2 protease family protein [Planctomycetota bacterium]